MRFASIVPLIAVVIVANQLATTAAEAAYCEDKKGPLAPSILEQVIKIDEVLNSLQLLLSQAQTAKAEVDQAIARGNTEPVMLEHQRVIVVRMRDISRQLQELQLLKQQLCAAAVELPK